MEELNEQEVEMLTKYRIAAKEIRGSSIIIHKWISKKCTRLLM